MRFDYLIYLYSLHDFRDGFIWYGLTMHLDILLQKGIRYKHHYQEITCIWASYWRLQFKMGSSFTWCRKKYCKITLTWIPGSYCQNWIGYYQWVSKPKYRWHCSKAKRTVHKTQKLWESIGETENKWRKVKDQEKQKIMLVLDETVSSKNTKILIHRESLDKVKNGLSSDNIKCEKSLCNNNIASDKVNSTIQVDA